jgi:hypothetical protein
MSFIFKHFVRVLAGVLFFAFSIHALARLGCLRSSLPSTNVDEIVLYHQSYASRSAQNADLLFIGDSSCLMDVSVPTIQRSIRRPVTALNLGALSYLPLWFFATLAKESISITNDSRTKTVILLVSPEMLSADLDPQKAAYAAELLRPKQTCDKNDPNWRITCPLGLQIFRNSIFNRFIPSVLSGEYGKAYGMNWYLWNFMSAEGGGLIDPHSSGRPSLDKSNWTLSRRIRIEAAEFREIFPPECRLLVGLSPVPAEMTGTNYISIHRALLIDFASLVAGTPLLELPATFPSSDFASLSHLNQIGRKRYSVLLAASLDAHESRVK